MHAAWSEADLNSGRPASFRRRTIFLNISLASGHFLILGTADVHSTTRSMPRMASVRTLGSVTSPRTTSSDDRFELPEALRAAASFLDEALDRTSPTGVTELP